MTLPLYYQDSYTREFDAKVVECAPLGDDFGVVLDNTAFYPEGGGEPGDRGALNKIEVHDTIKRGEKIIHRVSKSMPIGLKVHGTIEWPRRYDLMQFHTAQHLLSAVFWDLYQAETTSIHISENNASIDFSLDYLTWEMVASIEQKANQLIIQNLPVKTYWLKERAEVEKIPLRREVKKSAKEGVRIVEIEGYDYSACGGMHLHAIGEIGLLKILKWANVKDQVQVEFVFGTRALEDYARKNYILQDLTKDLTCQDLELADKIHSLQSEIGTLREKSKELFNELIELKIPEILDQSPRVGEIVVVTQKFNDLSPEDIKKVVNSFLNAPNTVCLLANQTGEGHKYALVFAHSIDSPDVTLHMGTLMKSLAQNFGVKGGGRPNYAQGGGKGENIDEILHYAETEIGEELRKKEKT